MCNCCVAVIKMACTLVMDSSNYYDCIHATLLFSCIYKLTVYIVFICKYTFVLLSTPTDYFSNTLDKIITLNLI